MPISSAQLNCFFRQTPHSSVIQELFQEKLRFPFFLSSLWEVAKREDGPHTLSLKDTNQDNIEAHFSALI